MTMTFTTMDSAYDWIERMMNKFDHYEIRNHGEYITVHMF